MPAPNGSLTSPHSYHRRESKTRHRTMRIPVLVLIVFALSDATQGMSFVVKRDKPLSPVILIPGDAGNRLEAKINKSTVPHFYCLKQTATWFSLWLNIEFMTPYLVDCWIDNIVLNYDNETRTTSNQPGVEIRVPGWGDPAVVEYLDSSEEILSAAYYMKDLVEALVRAGFERQTTIRAAPYDFRKGPAENLQWFGDLKQLVEESFNFQGAPVTLICHSMGCLMSLLFLQQQTPEWKDKFVARYVTLAGAWGGSVKALKVFAMGDSFGAFTLTDATLRPEQISMPSLAFLLPSPHFWAPNETLISTSRRDYSVNDLQAYFQDLKYPTGWEMRKDMLPFVNHTAPGVETFCMYGKQLPTVETLSYTGADPSTSLPFLLTGSGDGTVNLRSLRGCNQWVGQQREAVHVTELPGVDHYYGILTNSEVIDRIVQIVVA